MTTMMTSAAMPTPTGIQILCDSVGVSSPLASVLVSDSDTNIDDDDVITVGLYAPLCSVGGNRVLVVSDVGKRRVDID